MEGEGLFVELGRLDGAGGALDAEAHQLGRRDVAGADGAGLAVHIGAVIEERALAVPVAVKA